MKNSKNKIKLEDIKSSIDRSFDLFICSGSFEERSKSIPKQFDTDYFGKVFVCFNKDHDEYVGSNAVEIFEHFVPYSEYLELNSSSQIATTDIFFRRIKSFLIEKRDAKILLDITTFQRHTLLILLRILRNLLSKSNLLTLLYSPAGEYSVGLPDEEKWLSKNISEINSILGYSGIMMPTNPMHLIILFGLEFERALSLIYEYEPTIVSVGYPTKESSSDFKHYDLNLAKVELMKQEYPSVRLFEFPCDSVDETKMEIETQIKKYESHNTIIAPMNNKISTIAAALVAINNKKIQISYASAGYYNIESYSSPGEFCFILVLPDFLKDM